jgi:hypothetical protein
MKITRSQLKRIIKEELSRTLNEDRSKTEGYTGMSSVDDAAPAAQIKENLVNWLSAEKNINSMFHRNAGSQPTEEEVKTMAEAMGYTAANVAKDTTGYAVHAQNAWTFQIALTRDKDLKEKLGKLIIVDGIVLPTDAGETTGWGGPNDGYININSETLAPLLDQVQWVGSFTEEILAGVDTYKKPSKDSGGWGDSPYMRGVNLLVMVEKINKE